MNARQLIADAFGAATLILLPFVLAWAHFIVTGAQ